MIQRFRHFFELRSYGVRLFTALDMSGLSRFPLDIIVGILLLLLTWLFTSFVDQYGDYREAEAAKHTHKETQRAEVNLMAFNQCMKGQPFLLENGNVLYTEKALELPL